MAFLQVVGHAHAANPQPALRRVAADAGWPVLQFVPRSKASPSALARSLGAYSTLAATAVAKKEMAKAPLVGPLLQALDFAFIDRGNTPSAIATMQPAVDRLRNGLSIVVAPEGTRSRSPRLGRFRKGAFHLAMQAGVPLVQIVLHNTYEMMPRGSMLLRPGTVRVSVLPPVDVSDWTTGSLDGHVADIQALFQRALDRPPE